ncbi:MAG TPA: HD domain-containing protein [Opitutaceae bacterium]|jgi:3'-5' exoribonuclease|nr:HD domain-containing protein [Opitutaceae bacterium]
MADLPYSSVRDLKSAESQSGKAFASILVLRKVVTKTASNGNPFLSIELGDKTGSFGCTVFSDGPAYEPVRGAEEGAVLRVEGKIDSYQGRLSPKLTKASLVPAAELESPDVIANLVELPPEDPDVLWKELNAFADAITHPELRATVRNVMDDVGDSFRTSPAAISVHHAYRHGLLEHTVHMARACRALLPLYTDVDPELAMAGILLHDTGKTIEYEGSMATKRGRRGILQGHVVLGYQLVRKAAIKARLDAERTERLEHIILSHQGQLEWGAAALAATPEAVFVSMIDNLDAKMGAVQRTLRNAPDGGEFSERLIALDTQLLLKGLPPA